MRKKNTQDSSGRPPAHPGPRGPAHWLPLGHLKIKKTLYGLRLFLYLCSFLFLLLLVQPFEGIGILSLARNMLFYFYVLNLRHVCLLWLWVLYTCETVYSMNKFLNKCPWLMQRKKHVFKAISEALQKRQMTKKWSKASYMYKANRSFSTTYSWFTHSRLYTSFYSFQYFWDSEKFYEQPG